MPLRRLVAYAALAVLVPAGAASASEARVADAAEGRDAKAVAALLKQRADVNVAQPDGATALHWAAHWDDLAMTKLLLASGARSNVANDYGVTPLFLAATNGSADVVGALLDAGADSNATLPTGQTVLMTAARSGSAAAVRRLLAGGADADAAQASKGQTALMWAATAKKADVVKALIEGGANVNAQSKSGFTPLLFAAREGAIDVSRLLIASGADIEGAANDFSTPLLVATVRGHTGLARFLLDQGAKPDGHSKAGFTPLHYAAFRSEHSFARKDTELDGEWEAMAGIPDREAKLALIEALLARGANIEARASRPPGGGLGARDGTTPFVVAAMSGDAPLMRLLMARGARPVVSMPDGSSLVMAIISAGNAFTTNRITEAERIEAIKLALELGADIEAQDPDGYRAMHLAAAAEFHQIILFLLAQNADLNPVTKSRIRRDGRGTVDIAGQSPLGIVEGTFLGGTYNERPETAAFLRKLGAKSIGRATLETYVAQQQEERQQQQQQQQQQQDQSRPQNPPK
jgi:ankyrin repeat protein